MNWKVEGTDSPLFEITTNNNAGTLYFKDSPDFEDPQDSDTNNFYAVTVRAVDPGGRESAARAFRVQVTNENEPGAVTVSHNGDEPWYGGLQPRVGVELLAYATDPDHIQDDVDITDDDVTWQWYRGDMSNAACDIDSDNCLIDGADESAYTPTAGDVGKHLTVVASYFDKENISMRKSADSKSMYVTQAAGANELPTFEQDETTQTGDTPYGSDTNTLIDLEPFNDDGTNSDVVVQLEISEDASIGDMVGPGPIAATDPDEGDELTYSIEDTTDDSGHAEFFAIDRATGQITLKKMVNKEADGCGADDQCLVTVTATDSSGDPGAGSRVQLDLQIEIINVNELPVITGDNAVSIDEGETDIDAITATTDVRDFYEATDADLPAQTLTWSLSGVDADFFGFGEAGESTHTRGDLRFKEAPDFEDPKDANGDNTYEVTLNVSDGTGTATLDVKVTVNNVVVNADDTQEEPGEIESSHPQPRVGVPFVATLKDDDGGIRSQSWQWSIDGDGASTPAGDISGATSASYTPQAGDVGGKLTATVTYLDASSKDQTEIRTATKVFDNAVGAALDPNSAPTFAEDRYARELAENADTDNAVTLPDGTDAGSISVTDEGDVVEFSLSGADSEYFDVDSDAANNLQAVITPKSPLNYESPKDADRNNIYVFTLTATDSYGEMGTATVSVTVTDEEETLAVGTIAPMTVEENSPLRTNVGKPIEPSDPGDSTYQTYELNDGADDSGHSDYFRIHRDDGQISVDKALDYEATPAICAANVCSVTVTITGWKTDDENANESVQVGQVTTEAFTITITDMNEAPRYSGAQVRYVPENAWKLEGVEPNEVLKRDTKTGKPATLGSALRPVTDDDSLDPPNTDLDLYRTTLTAAGDPVAASDPDASPPERVLYTLSGPDAMYFGIYRASGQIITQDILDYESMPAGKKYFTVQVTATDRAGLSDTTDVTINVVDVNEPPLHVEGLSILGQPGRNYDENDTDAVGTYEVEGVNAATATWSVDGADGSLFTVAPASGTSTTLRFMSSPNYEMAMDDGEDNVYNVTVKATDSNNSAVLDTMDVTVTVEDVDEPGSITGLPATAAVGDTLTATLADEDGATNTVWQWARGGSDISGATSATYTVADDDAGMSVSVTATYDDVHGSNTVTSAGVMVTADDRPQAVQDYDSNNDMSISITELFVAIDDYFEGGISIAELFEVIDAYFES